MSEPELAVKKMTGFVQISQQLVDDYGGVSEIIGDALRRALAGEPGVFKEPTPPPTVDDLYDEWSDGHGADGVDDWRDFLIGTIGDEGWQALAYEAARAAFKAGYEAGYDLGAWENS